MPTRGEQRIAVRLQLAEPSAGSMEPLLALKSVTLSPAGAFPVRAATGDSESSGSSNAGGSGDSGQAAGEQGAMAGCKVGPGSKPVGFRKVAALDKGGDDEANVGGDRGSDAELRGAQRAQEDPRCAVADG
jgi:hypothetical protein